MYEIEYILTKEKDIVQDVTVIKSISNKSNHRLVKINLPPRSSMSVNIHPL